MHRTARPGLVPPAAVRPGAEQRQGEHPRQQCMYLGLTIGAVIPAYNEEDNIGAVVGGLLKLRTADGDPFVDDLVVCDNGSSDSTGSRALAAGARVTYEEIPGYGRACLKAIAALKPVDVVLFVDGDQAFDVKQSLDLLEVLAAGADLVIGSRVTGQVEPGAMSFPQIVGNRVASLLIRILWRRRVSDLGPFRAIRSDGLRRLQMRDTAYGWTVEMQVKAIQANLRMAEVPVDTIRRRFGSSKIGGTVRGVFGASWGILTTIFRLRIQSSGIADRSRPH